MVSSLSLESTLVIVRIESPLTLSAPLAVSSALRRLASSNERLLHLLHVFERLERRFVDGGWHRTSATIYDKPVLFDLDRLVEWNMGRTLGLLLSRKGKDGATGD
jgi:hypothetical protein